MKKIFILLSMLAALALTVVPSQALIGMPDDVPACDFIQGFFMVEVGGGLNTLVVFNEVLGVGGAGAGTGNLHWILRDRRSNHLADFNLPYTANDVVSVSVRDMIEDYCNDAGRTALTMTLNSVDYYIGYIEWENNSIFDTMDVGTAAAPTTLITNWANNMVGKIMIIDTTAGKTSGANLPGKEALAGGNYTGTRAFTVPGWPYNWLAAQSQTWSVGDDTPQDADFRAPLFTSSPFEGFTAQALAASEQREGSAVGVVMAPVAGTTDIAYAPPTKFTLVPRYYLYDDTAAAENYVFLWKSQNDGGGIFPPLTVTVLVYDTDENPTSLPLPLPDELNVINMREWLPTHRLAAVPCAGWIDISFDATNYFWFDQVDWMGYNLQVASSADAGLNWSLLYQVPRWVDWGTVAAGNNKY